MGCLFTEQWPLIRGRVRSPADAAEAACLDRQKPSDSPRVSPADAAGAVADLRSMRIASFCSSGSAKKSRLCCSRRARSVAETPWPLMQKNPQSRHAWRMA